MLASARQSETVEQSERSEEDVRLDRRLSLNVNSSFRTQNTKGVGFYFPTSFRLFNNFIVVVELTSAMFSYPKEELVEFIILFLDFLKGKGITYIYKDIAELAKPRQVQIPRF